MGENEYDFKNGHNSPKYWAYLKVDENSGDVPGTLAGVEQFHQLVHTSSVPATGLNSLIVNYYSQKFSASVSLLLFVPDTYLEKSISSTISSLNY